MSKKFFLQTKFLQEIIYSFTLFGSNLCGLKARSRNYRRRCIVLEVKVSCCRGGCHSDLHLRTGQGYSNLNTLTVLLRIYIKFLIIFTNPICPKSFFYFIYYIIFCYCSTCDKSFLLFIYNFYNTIRRNLLHHREQKPCQCYNISRHNNRK